MDKMTLLLLGHLGWTVYNFTLTGQMTFLSELGQRTILDLGDKLKNDRNTSLLQQVYNTLSYGVGPTHCGAHPI
jgi:hypothetical protein